MDYSSVEDKGNSFGIKSGERHQMKLDFLVKVIGMLGTMERRLVQRDRTERLTCFRV